MGLAGFFETRSDAKATKRGGSPARLVRDATDINRDAKTPDMPPSGSKTPRVYILGEAPGEEEDAHGVQFVGKSGKRLRRFVPEGEEVRWNNVVRTRPPENRTPTPDEVEHYRPALLADIEATRPAAIMAVGGVALSALIPSVGRDVGLCRGRRFPVRFGQHEVWVYPVHHPAWVMRVESQREVDGAPGDEWARIWELDIKRVFQDRRLDPPETFPMDQLDAGVELLTDVEKILARLKQLSHPNVSHSDAVAAFDFETSCLRPYKTGAKLLTISLAIGSSTVAFPLEHPGAEFTKEDQGRIWGAFLAWLSTPATKVAHNLAFELEWIGRRAGRLRLARWSDTKAQAYILDERQGGLSLEFSTQLHFGFPIKDQSNVSRKNAEGEYLGTLLRYNALDSKFTLLLHYAQMKRIAREKLQGALDEQLRRIPSAVGIQLKGLAIDQERRAQFVVELGNDLADVQRTVSALPVVETYRKRYGQFNPNSTDDCAQMFRDVLGRKEGARKGGRYSTDEDVLKQMKDEPLAAEILKLRGASKLKSTYVDRLDPKHRDTYVWPDGCLHPQFKTLSTDTGRFASEDPSGQNWPKRKRADIRSQVVPRAGHVFVAVDYSQIEARVIAMFSGDARLVRSIKDRYDIHLEWAKRLAKAHPPLLDRYGGDVNKFRKVDVKSSWTFPLFYGAKAELVSALLEMPRAKAEKLCAEFWDEYQGVTAWGKELRRFYKRNGYVETLTGRRRRAPLSDNQIGNSPVQGTASDLCVDGLNRLSERAEREDRPELQACLNIHDDLTFEVPRRRLEETIGDIVDAMVNFGYPWLNGIPIEVEVSVGRNWYELEPIGKFASDEAA